MSALECSIRREGDCYVVSLIGDFLMENAAATRKIMFDCIDDGRPLLADLSGVRRMDSSAVASLVEVYHCALRKGVGFGLAAVGGEAFSVLRLVRLDNVFPIFATLEEGLDHLSVTQRHRVPAPRPAPE